MSKKSKSNKETLQNLPSFETTEDEIRTGNNLDKEVVLEVEKEEVEEFSEDDFIVPENQPTTEPLRKKITSFQNPFLAFLGFAGGKWPILG